MSDMKLCKDCTFYDHKPRVLDALNVGIGFNWCGRVNGKPSPVYGERINWRLCVSERAYRWFPWLRDRCGPEGKYWAQRRLG